MSPIFSRRTLRQRLGTEFLHDTVVGTTTGSWGTQAGSANIVDSAQADTTASGESLFQRHYLRLLGSAGLIQDLRVASFNTGSGAYCAAVTLATTIFSGMPYEVHGLISPTDKDKAIDSVIKNLRTEQEYPLWSIPNGFVYSLGTDVLGVMGVKYFSDPANSLNLGEHVMAGGRFEITATGQQLRIPTSLPASYQLIIQALVSASLGAGDLATVNLVSDDLVMWGATAKCLWLLETKAPGQETAAYRKRREEAAHEYSKLARRFQPVVYHPLPRLEGY